MFAHRHARNRSRHREIAAVRAAKIVRVGEEVPGAPPNHVPAILVVALGPGLAGVREAVARSLAAADAPSLDDADAWNGEAFRVSETDIATDREKVSLFYSHRDRVGPMNLCICPEGQGQSRRTARLGRT